ncbi:FkbM family methyltransferase [Telluria mixta]|uniref:FkbM family methyltransferase n=1 Tax=Telluria mixta TaxID=34071 RepID=A0ABT2C0R0_9BURK|nr:FkbM family methyltransferase [Telluria mixta]MCS0630970.1 FkbM family methyltransferase [Telluria mixta]WEM98968.1 FkbM family methyltransferase [Telluria mixta]
MSDNVFELSADGVSYRMLLPNADIDYIQRKLATEHVPYELPMLEDMRTRLAADDLVVDAGANIGNHTMYLAAVVGCRVVAFEPNAKLAEALRASLALNALDGKVDVRELGLGKRAGRGQFAKNIPDNLGAQSITGGEGPLEIAPLDSIDFPAQVKAVKIDVEGMELDVLEGAAGLIGRDRPIVYVECADQVSFRQVHEWMVAKNYGYWDTFNATPTHLFLPSEQTTVDQRLSRLQLKGAQDIYQLQEQIAKTREMLDSANLKYRAANEQIANLKVQLTQQEAARTRAEQVANDAQGQLVEMRNRLEAERASLQQEIQRLSGLAESHREAAHDAEKQLIRIEATLEVARAQAAEATAGRNRAESDSERQAAAVRELTDKLTTANDQLATTRDSLHEANRKYRVVTEQVQEVRRKAEHDDSLTKMAAESAAKTQAQLVETQARLLAERGALVEEINKLRQDWQEASNGAHEVEKQLVRVEVQLQVEKDALAAANNKYRESVNQIATLKQRVAEEEQAARSAEKLWGEVQAAMEQLKDELGKMTARYQAEKEALEAANAMYQAQKETLDAANAKYEAEKEARDAANAKYEAEKEALDAANAKYEAESEALDAANEKCRQAMTEVTALKQRVAEEEQAARGAEQLWGHTQVELHQLKNQLDQVTTSYHTATESVSDLNAKIAAEAEVRRQIERKEEEARAQLTLAQLQYRAAQTDLKQVKTELNNTTQEYRVARERATDLGRQLNDVNLKYRRINNEEIPQLKARVQSSQAQAYEHKRQLEQLKLELTNHKTRLKETNHQLERVRQQKMQAEQQVIKTRASLSFQLGYILINGFKSVRGFIGIPSALLAWRKEVVKRRKQKEQRLQKLQPVNIVPAAQAPAVARTAPPPLDKVEKAAPIAPIVSDAQVEAMDVIAEIKQQEQPAEASQVLPRDLRHLKVACIMDEFTFGSYRSECDLFQLTPAHWQTELESFKPELLFIESAWRGKDELWGSKVGHNSQELQGIVAWCRQHGVPTVFWNKEDPVHFETFLSTAMLFDCVFTTDIDCIHRYKAALKHDNVFLLPFACQPKNNHPIETYERKDAFCFAGAYYVRYPDRTRDLGNFISELPGFRPVEIYDRNYGKNDPNYQFPPEYQPYIVGTLPFDQIDKAYKGYRYAINLNSIKQSQTMFARRVFELMASNTITVSNFSRGIRLMFGDLVITTDSGHEMVRHLETVAGDEVRSAKLRLAALRKVLQEHTYEQRLAYVFAKVSGGSAEVRQPAIAVLATAANQTELDMVRASVARQTYAHCRVHVLLGMNFTPVPSTDERVRFLPHADAATLDIGTIAQGADFVAGMVAQDYYGPNYLLDIALATTYSGAQVIGKNAHYAWDNGAVAMHAAGTAYRPAPQFALRSAAVRLACVAEANAASWLAVLPTSALGTEHGLAIDEFNYCRNGQHGADLDLVTTAVCDLQGLDTGVPVAELLRLAERIPPAAEGAEQGEMISGKRLSEAFGRAPSAAIQAEFDGDNWCFRSQLGDGKHEYLYATTDFTLETLGWTNKAEFYFDTTPGLNLQLVLVFLDAQKQKISHVIKHANRNQDAEIPLGTVSVRIGLRIYAGGSCDIKGLILGHRNLQPAEIIGKADRLILTNHYPSYDDLYRNGFVHSRVMAYRERGIRCDVFRMRPAEPVSYHEFADVDVTTGSQEVLHQMLSSGRYKTVMVHFLEPAMWEVLQHHIDRIKVVVWVHGAEIQPWHRRDYNYSTEEERTVAKMKSAARMEFWQGLLRPMPANLKLVFVSRYFAEEVMEDIGFRIPEEHYTIIHNPIDTDVFSYQPKPAEQRTKVLSIRPYASAKYANDLSVKAIQLLAEKPWFQDMEFRMIGDGPLFDTLLEPLRQYGNVLIERRFLKQSEIAALHKEYGIFLSPTRMDAQGVSRDEAMASGLVPVTNGVTAIPEFVDEQCGILAPGEDAVAMAEGIAAMYENPELFMAMSEQAALRVKRQSAKEKIVDAEIKEMA